MGIVNREWDLLLLYRIGRKYEYKVWRRHQGEDNVNIEVATKLFFSNVLSKVESQHQQQVL